MKKVLRLISLLAICFGVVGQSQRAYVVTISPDNLDATTPECFDSTIFYDSNVRLAAPYAA